ncbi:MAG TPA: hypothetical protein DCE18_13910 [Syntrophobacteraceae bacterium]|nr:hypothetical protein [Syntrophobacteraceae bacterium]
MKPSPRGGFTTHPFPPPRKISGPVRLVDQLRSSRTSVDVEVLASADFGVSIVLGNLPVRKYPQILEFPAKCRRYR